MAFHLPSGLGYADAPAVWVVDDDEDDRLFISSAFEDTERPISVITLTDGDQLLPELATCVRLPQLILLDINMNRQNGFDTLTQLRSTPTFAHLPVVMFSTSSDNVDRQRSLALGANQFMTKPANYNQLVSVLKGLADTWAIA
ncbi:response regulator [Spirosoma fluviale]|uniref:Response regulator receiver domain-containing protein n=1 Tax=Spirosoma fluviale TaxID=1597977 RepID=A0A286G1P1_9BACT|nr:response regulator [Spirosoma fluviale]SOD89413.1 Response regulator receiver domain-containing protein [Spirosoma fluviale]